MNLALFDFDGTITSKDTFTPFIYLSVPRNRGKKLIILTSSSMTK